MGARGKVGIALLLALCFLFAYKVSEMRLQSDELMQRKVHRDSRESSAEGGERRVELEGAAAPPTLEKRNRVHILQVNETIALSFNGAGADHVIEPVNAPSVAIATLVTRKEYLIGAYALGASLRKVKSVVPRILLLPRKFVKISIECASFSCDTFPHTCAW